MARHDLLSARVARLCDDVAVADPGLAETAARIKDGLGRPLALAVVGRVKAGKSTLVNALIGEHVAPTNEAECTRVVTWYEYGAAPGAHLVLRDGSTRAIEFDGALPDELGVPAEDVSHAVVRLPAAPLRDFILIDTPGLSTSSEDLAEQTRRAILGTESASLADAILYVFRATEKLDDVEFLRAFAEAGAGKQSASAIGVLSHADQFGGGAWGAEDPIDVARGIIGEIAERRRGELAEVVVVAGRLAEQARTGEVRERDARMLGLLAALGEEDVQDLQYAPFPVDGLEPEQLQEVLTQFHGYALRYGRQAAAEGAGALTAWLERRSGMAGLQSTLRARYVGRFPELKAAQGVAALRAAAERSPHRLLILDLIGEAMIEDALLPLELLEAWEELRVKFPDSGETAELDAALGSRDDRELLGLPPDADSALVLERALLAASRTQADANLASNAAIAAANRALSRAYLLVADTWA